MKGAARQGGRGEEPHRYNAHAPFEKKKIRLCMLDATVIPYQVDEPGRMGLRIDGIFLLRYLEPTVNKPHAS